MPYYCNPINVFYPYSFKRDPRDHFQMTVNREAADPSMVFYRGRYYIFASMTASVWVSEDMAKWKNFLLPDSFPIYDYAPDACVVGDWLYLTASNRGKPCSFYRTKDPVHGPYEEIRGSMDFWDPDLFADDDGRLYLYYGCSNTEPIRGVEVDPDTMKPKGEAVDLISGDPWKRGYERFGENHGQEPRTEAEIDRRFCEFLDASGKGAEEIPEENQKMIRAVFSGRPYIEGAWMTKYRGCYYLQYACPGAEFNVYGDGVYISDRPLGPFVPAESNPFSYHPGGFMPGAGHGSTMEDAQGAWWHASTMRISVSHVFERRVGIWPAGFDEEGSLFCNQRYGDWPLNTEKMRKDPWADPDWYLLSYKKVTGASSFAEGHEPGKVADENARTWWEEGRTEEGIPEHLEKGSAWLQMDLGGRREIHAIQINFADDMQGRGLPTCPGQLVPGPDMSRFIDRESGKTRWILELSEDGICWKILADKSHAETDLAHDLVVSEEGIMARFVRLTVLEVPYGSPCCISGLRVFGTGDGEKPDQPKFQAVRTGERDMIVSLVPDSDRTGCLVLWGADRDHLYHSCLVYGNAEKVEIGALVQGTAYSVRVDAFNENGITEGVCVTQA